MASQKSLIIKKTLCVLLFVVLLLAVLLKVYNIFRWKDTTGGYMSSIEQLKNTPDDTIDVVFVGSSHVYCDIYPCFIWESYGIPAFNMSVSGQDKDSSYYHLKKLLKTQSPEVVCVDLYGLLFDKHDIEGNVYRNMLALDTSIDSVKLVNDYFEGDSEANRKDYYFRWPIIHTRYRELQKYDFRQYIPNKFLRGEELIFNVGEAYPSPSRDTPFAPSVLSPKNAKWLDRLYDLSLKEGFSLVFFLAPTYLNNYSQSIIDAASMFAEERGIPFIDFNKLTDELSLNYETDFYDSNHTNAYGAKKMTDYFGQYLNTHFDFIDRREDPLYWQWDADYEYYCRQEKIHNIDASNDLDTFFTTFPEISSDYTAIISVEFTSLLDNAHKDYLPYLQTLGFDQESFSQGGKWLYDNGTLVKIHDNDEAPAYTCELSNTDTLAVKYVADGSFDNVMINTKGYSNTGTYLSIILYDKNIKEVAIQKCY